MFPRRSAGRSGLGRLPFDGCEEPEEKYLLTVLWVHGTVHLGVANIPCACCAGLYVSVVLVCLRHVGTYIYLISLTALSVC
jgi:hypothetical protein